MRMNILYYLDYFPKLSESFILNEIYYLTQQGHNVAVFSLNEPETDLDHEELDEVDINLTYAEQPSATSLPTILVKNLFEDRVLYATEFDRIQHRVGTRFLAKQCLDFIESLEYEVDHVHTHFVRWNKLPAARVADAVGASSSVTTHAYDLYASPDEEALKTTCDAFDSVFTISEYNERFINVEIDPDANVEVVRMGIRAEKFTPSETPEEPRLLTIARFVEKKGIEYALYAVAECVDEYPELEYRIIGSGPRRDRYEEIIAEEGIEDHVRFLGSVSDEQLIDELDRARAFLLPCVVAKDGDRDGIPVVLMEAMAMETPPITTDVSGIPELVTHRKSGLVCGERNITQLSTAIKRMIRADRDYVRITVNARETVYINHDVRMTGEKLESLFQ